MGSPADKMKLFHLFLLAFLTALLGTPSKSYGGKLEGENFVNGEFATPQLLSILNTTMFSTLEILRQLMVEGSTKGPNAEKIHMLCRLYFHMSTFAKIGERNKLSPFLVYWVSDEMIDAIFCEIKIKKPNYVISAGVRFDRNFKKILKKRLECNIATFQKTTTSKEPGLLDAWIRGLLLMQELALNQMHRSLNHYENVLVNFTGNGSLVSIAESFIGKILPKPGDLMSGPFRMWHGAVKECEDKYLDDLCTLALEGYIPENVDFSFIAIIVQLNNVIFNEAVEIDIRSRVREHAFMSFPEQKGKKPFIIYMRDRKVKTASTYLSESNLPIHARLSICEMLLKSTRNALQKYWDSCTDPKKRSTLAGLVNGIEYIREAVSTVSRESYKISTATRESISFDKLACTYGLMMEVFGKFVLPLLSETMQAFCKTTFVEELTITDGFGEPIQKLFNIIEGSLAGSLETMDKELVRAIYRYLEFCRALTFLTDNLIHMTTLRPFPCSGFYTKQYRASHGYLKSILDVRLMELMETNYEQLCDFSHQTGSSLVLLYNGKDPIPEVSVDFYHFIQTMLHENPTDDYWKVVAANATKAFYAYQYGDAEPDTEPETQVPEVKTRLSKIPTPKKKKQGSSTKRRKTQFIEDDADMIVRNSEPAAIVRAVPPVEENLTDGPQLLALTGPEPDTRNEDKPPKKKNKIEKKLHRIKSIVQNPLEFVSNGTNLCLPVSSKLLLALDPLALIKDKVPSYVIPRPVRHIAQSRTHVLTYHVQEPTHHVIAAKALGYKEPSSIDPRDYMMAHLLIGQRVWVEVVKPLLDVLEPMESEHHLIQSFKRSMESFKQDLETLSICEPAIWKSILRDAGIKDIGYLFKCLDYYHKRTVIAHPNIPDSKKLRDFFTARHISTLELNNVLDPVKIRRLQQELQCPETIATKKIDTRRPSNLIDPEETDTALAVIWMRKVSSNDKIVVTRRLHAHKEVSDKVFMAYIDYIFADHEDLTFLRDL